MSADTDPFVTHGDDAHVSGSKHVVVVAGTDQQAMPAGGMTRVGEG